MTRLALRLALAGGRADTLSTAITAVAVALGTAVLLFALSFQPALDVRTSHGAWRDAPSAEGTHLATATEGLLLSETPDHVAGRRLVRMDVAALAAAPVPPGVPRVPAPGEAYVSPELARLLAAMPADQLGDRFGRIVGVIGEAGLRAPDELVALVGAEPEFLRRAGARVVLELPSQGRLVLNALIQLLVAVAAAGALAPVAVFVATATRLSAARRERRLAAFRLAGATPAQVHRLAAVETLLVSVPGTLLGVALFALARPLVARIPLEGIGWFDWAIVPPVVPAAVLLAAIPVVGAIASLVALRRLSISPLGVVRRTRPAPLGRRRLVPLGASVAAFAGSLLAAMGPWRGEDIGLRAVGGSFVAIVVAIVVAGPWVTAACGRLVAGRGGATTLLAGRRLTDDPRATFGSIAGVVLAVFVAATFFSIASLSHAVTASAVPAELADGLLLARLPWGADGRVDDLVGRLPGEPGVRSVVGVREAHVIGGIGPGRDRGAWIAPCEPLAATLGLAGECGAGPLHATGDLAPAPGAVLDLQGTAAGATAGGPGPEVRLALEVPAGGASPLVPAAPAGATGPTVGDLLLPALVVDPAALPDGGRALRVATILVATDGTPATTERVRTAIEVALPTASVATIDELVAGATLAFTELGRVVGLGVVGVLLVAGCSLAVGVVGGLVDRRRPFALLRTAGMPLRAVRTVLLLEAGVPLVAITTLSALLGVAVGQLLLRLTDAPAVPPPDAGLLVLVGGGIAASLGVVALALPLVGPITALEEARVE